MVSCECNQRSISCPGTRKNLVHHVLKWSCGIDDDAVFRNVFFRLIQAHCEFPFLWFSALSSDIRNRPLVLPHGELLPKKVLSPADVDRPC
jgi:hypothetical protein